MDNYIWTRHSEWKMKQYALSKQRVKRVIRNPERIEKSIVPGMIAVMQVGGTSKNRYEIWTMYSLVKSSKTSKSEDFGERKPDTGLHPTISTASPVARFRELRRREFAQKQDSVGNGKSLRIISAWKYPGKSPKRDPIPQEILEEIYSQE